MPDLIRHDLIFRALPNNAYFFCLFALVKLVELSVFKQNFTASAPMRRKNGFQLPQKRRFAAARRTAEDQKLARLDGQRKVGNCLLFLFGVSEIQAFDCIDCHCRASFLLIITGVRTSARYTNMKLTVRGVHAAVLTVG